VSGTTTYRSIHFLGPLAKLRRATLSLSYLFVLPHGTGTHPPDEFLLNYIFVDFSKICRGKFKFH